MDVQPIVDRLRERLADLALREIDAAAGLAAAMRDNRAAPALYVIPLAERATYMPHTGYVEEQETRLFGCVMALETLDFSRGTGSSVSLEQLRKRIKQALVGWVMEEETGEPVLFQGGELLDFPGDGRLWWADDFVMTGYFRSEL